MASKLRPAGIELFVKNYNTYLNQQKQLKKAHQEAFNTKPLNRWTTTAKQMVNSMSVVTSSTNTTNEAISKLKNTINDTSGISRFTSKFSDLGTKLSWLRAKYSSSGKSASKFGTALKNSAVGANTLLTKLTPLIRKIPLLGAALAALNMKQYIDQSTALAVRNETLGVTFDVVAARAGFTAEQADHARDALKKTGITTAGATKQLQKMAQAGLDWGQAAKLARVAQDAAVIAGYDSTAAFESMTWAIQTGSAEILDNFGIMVRFGKVYEEYAKEVGKSATALTEQEKLQSRMNAVLKEGEKIAGTYTAALGTAGKMQGSMVRVTEELGVNVGEVFLPFETLSTEIKMNFVKGLLEASKGLKQFKAVSATLIEFWKSSSGILSEVWRLLFGNLDKGAKESMSIFERFGRGLQAWARMIVESFAIADAAAKGFRKAIQDVLVNAAIGLGKFFRGDFAGAQEAFGNMKDSVSNFGAEFKATMKEDLSGSLAELHEKFPDLYTDWDDLGKVAEVNMDKVTSAIDEAIAALENQKKELGAQSKAVAQISKVYENFEKATAQTFADFEKNSAKAFDEFRKNAAKLEDDLKKSLQKASTKRDKELAKLDDQSGKQRQKLIDDGNKRRLKREKKANNDLAKERARFQLSQLQSLRRFQLQDTRLQAAGDVLALKTLREDFALKKQEEKENFEASSKDTKKSIADQNNEDESALKDRLNELKNNIEQRRAEINNSHKEETDNLAKNLIENQNKLKADYNEQLTLLATARDEQLQMLMVSKDKQLVEIGKSLRDNALITKEGMENIGNIIGETFGDDGAAINLLKGWTDTSRTQTEQAMMQIKDQFVQLDKDIEKLQEKRKKKIEENSESFRKSSKDIAKESSKTSKMILDNLGIKPGGLPPPLQREGGRRNIPMRQGGSGVVEGPASFNVEPGVREAFSFMPINKFSGDVNVRGRAGLDVTGMGSDISSDIERRIANKMIEEISIAIERISKRG